MTAALAVARDVLLLLSVLATLAALLVHLCQQQDSNALLRALLEERKRTLHLVRAGEPLPDLEADRER